MERTSSPAVDRARTADSRPAPGPLTATSTVRSPDSFALFAAVSDACCAANGVPLRDPRKPSDPELDQEITLPMGSVMVTIVLLNDACTWTRPIGTERFSFFLNAFFLPVFAGAFAMFYPFRSSPRTSSCWLPCRGADPCGCGRWYACAARAQAGLGGDASRDKRPFR